MTSVRERSAPPAAAPPARGIAFGIGRRLGVAFALLAVLLGAIGLVVSLQVGRMHTSSQRVLEEQRESGHSRDVLHALRALEEQLTHPRPSSAHLDRAEAALALLERGPRGLDPSEERHAGSELRLYAELEEALLDVRRSLGEGDAAGDPASTLVPLARAGELAQSLHDEMSAAERRASQALDRDARRMRDEVLWTTLAALAVVTLVTWRVRRSIVRPVEVLREGAARLGQGDLRHRVALASHDELGELATEFNRMADELEEMRSSLEARVEERTAEFVRAARLAGLGTMAAGIAHEINNPLASIASCAEGLERRLAAGTATKELEREYLQIIAREAYRAHGITSRLLEFARTDSGTSVPFELSALLREIEVLLEHKLRSRGLVLEIACDPALPALEGDPSECKQVLLNLLDNAIDASPRGGRIAVRCRRERGEVVLEVEDQGPGIPPGDLDRIFDPFFTTKAPGQGTGLGLAIVHRIVESHGGRIEVLDTGHGATFRVRLPGATLGRA